jgi:hypothetical protein
MSQAVVAFIFVLETNTGATVRAGALRLIGTIGGAIFAYIVGQFFYVQWQVLLMCRDVTQSLIGHYSLQAWVICKQNPYGIVTMITVSNYFDVAPNSLI